MKYFKRSEKLNEPSHELHHMTVCDDSLPTKYSSLITPTVSRKLVFRQLRISKTVLTGWQSITQH